MQQNYSHGEGSVKLLTCKAPYIMVEVVYKMIYCSPLTQLSRNGLNYTLYDILQKNPYYIPIVSHLCTNNKDIVILTTNFVYPMGEKNLKMTRARQNLTVKYRLFRGRKLSIPSFRERKNTRRENNTEKKKKRKRIW